MSRLARYLALKFTLTSLAIYAVAATLVWLTQMLRLFELVTAKGQSLLVLAGQSLLTSPQVARQIIYIFIGIALLRVLRGMQQSHELHTIHSSRRVSAIWSAFAVFSLGGALLALFISNWAEPVTKQSAARWTAEIAVDLLGRTLTPGRFTQFSKGLVVHIGGREPDGTIVNFFADDNRDENIRRTYLAETSVIVSDDEGFQISLRNGRLQVTTKEGEFSEVEFSRYDLAVASLTNPREIGNPTWGRDSFSLIAQAFDEGKISPQVRNELNMRMAEGPRIIGLNLFIAAIFAFPHGRRGRTYFPPEFMVIIVAFLERWISNTAANSFVWGGYLGPSLTLTAGILILIWRLTPRKPVPAKISQSVAGLAP